MKELKKNQVFKTIIILLLVFLTILSLALNITTKNIINLNQPLNMGMIPLTIISIFLYKYYLSFYFKNKRKDFIFSFISIIFSLFLIFGESYSKVGDASLIFGSLPLFIIAIIRLLGYYFLIYPTVNNVFNFFKNHDFKEIKDKKICKMLDEQPFKFTFFFLLIMWLPYMIAFYPGIFSPDPSFQVEQFFGIRTKYSDYNILLDENVTITNHHPVVHTVLLGSLIFLGKMLGSFNLGIFFYTFTQSLMLIALLSYTISYMKKLNTPLIIRFITLLIYGFGPVFPLYGMSTVKDVYFTIFVIFYLIRLFDLLKYENYSLKNLSILALLMLLITLFRNNGIYLVLMSFPFMLIVTKKRLKVLVTLLIPVVAYYSFTNVLLPYFKITPGSIREVLSIPFQQTARYVKYYDSEVTDEEKKIIDKILNYETLAQRYKPNIADPVKNEYNKYATKEDLKKYFGVWYQEFLKHPAVYIDATINNTYGYFYPDAHNWYIYHNYDKRLKKAGFDYHYNNLSLLRDVLTGYGEAYPYLPIVGLIVNIGFNTWCYMLLFCYLVKLKKYKYLIYVCPVISLVLVCIASPVNTYFRYTLPYVFALPITIAIFLNIVKGEVKK